MAYYFMTNDDGAAAAAERRLALSHGTPRRGDRMVELVEAGVREATRLGFGCTAQRILDAMPDKGPESILAAIIANELNDRLIAEAAIPKERTR